MVLYTYMLIVFSLRRELLKLILVDEPLLEVALSQYQQQPIDTDFFNFLTSCCCFRYSLFEFTVYGI
jgi:hypothetical protein